MQRHSVFLLLGANLGRKKETIHKAILVISNNIGRIVKKSKSYKTSPWGVENQPDFLNQVIEIETVLEPEKVLEETQKIEKLLGRVHNDHWAARIIDIDILYYDNEIVEQPHLKIPHPFIAQRRFALVPLADIAPNFIHPTLQKNNAQLLALCEDKGIVE